MTKKADQILAYLRTHPEFLINHAEELGVRPVEGKVLSFNQGSLDVLKHKTEKMAVQVAQMLNDAEQNREISHKLLMFNQKLLSANTLGQLWRAAENSLTDDFQLPCHVLMILAKPKHKVRVPVALDYTNRQDLQSIWSKVKKPICGHRLPDVAYALFDGTLVLESFLQLPIYYDNTLLAVLLIGHEQADYFHPDLATDLVETMANSLAVAMARMMGY